MESANGRFEVILASGSPRRRSILARIIPGASFRIVRSRIEELPLPGERPAKFAVRMASAKARQAADRIRLAPGRSAVILAADTVIGLAGAIIGQPRDAEDARRILRRLSGRRHYVTTGIAALRLPDRKLVRTSVTSSVWMKDLGAEVIDRYVRTAEPMDKAGAYGIQGRGKRLVRKYRGSYTNIVGLPMREARALLRRIQP